MAGLVECRACGTWLICATTFPIAGSQFVHLSIWPSSQCVHPIQHNEQTKRIIQPKVRFHQAVVVAHQRGIHAFLSRQSNHPHILDDPVAIQQIHPAIHKRIRPQPIIHTSIHSQNSMRPQPSSQCTRPINAHPFRASSASNDVQPYPPNQSRCREPLKTDRI